MSGRPPNDGGWQHRPPNGRRVRRGRRRLILLVLLLLVGAVVVSGYLTGWRNEPDTPEAVTAPPLTKLVFPRGSGVKDGRDPGGRPASRPRRTLR